MYARSTTGAGFTIVETLIFLAISGLMFVLAINAMSGKQQQTEFTTAVDSLRSELNQDLSNVGDGNYLALNNVGCTAASSSSAPGFIPPPAPSIPDGSCTVIGEIIAFSTSNTTSNGLETYSVFPAIGRNYYDNGGTTDIATNLTQADPQISTTYEQTVSMPFGLTIASLTSDGNSYGAFGLFSFTSFAGGTSSPNGGQSLNSGAEHVEIFALPLSTIGDQPGTTQGLVDSGSGSGYGLQNCATGNVDVCVKNNLNAAPINPPGGVTFCVNSGTTNKQSAVFSVGGPASPNSVTYQIASSGCP